MPLTYTTASLFAAPGGAVLVHACNTRGAWGAGIARAFRSRYPAAYAQYRAHCAAHGAALVGTCLLLGADTDGGAQHAIACLFTSAGYGRARADRAEILAATRAAVADLMRQNGAGRALHACRFNSGMFGVPWEDTAAVLEELGVEMVIYTPEETTE